jgi:hypothetical protein
MFELINMKYRDFYAYLDSKVSNIADIGPHISIRIKNDGSWRKNSISIGDKKIQNIHRFLIFPIKIYGENIHHLNVLLLDRKNKYIERYEPFNQYIYFNQINELIESLLNKLMEEQKIYFLKYQSTINTEKILNDKNCGVYCVQYVLCRIKHL